MISIQLQGPEWFLIADAALQALAGLISIGIAFVSLRIYRAAGERKYLFFNAAFALLALGFFSRAAANAMIGRTQAAGIFLLGYLTYIFTALLAYALLITLTSKAGWRVFALLLLILVPAMLFSGSYFLSFYTISTILLGVITINYLKNYLKKKSTASLLVFMAFALITIAQPLFMFEALKNVFYIAAQITQTAGYLLLLSTLIRTTLR